MTSPDKPLRFEIEVELAGTPQQVWEAIASAGGISSWFMPTELEPRQGGAVVTHMGDDSSPAWITAWTRPAASSTTSPSGPSSPATPTPWCRP